MRRSLKISLFLLGSGLVGLILAVVAILGAYIYVAPDLPSVETLRDTRMQVPLRVYSRDGRLMAEYGEQRRVPLDLDAIPDTLEWAFLSAEDDRYYEHPGVDWMGIARAAYYLITTGSKAHGGGSTITMQVARNFFLTFEQTYTRKIKEIFLALKIERELSKQEILTLYLNKIYLGNRAYGVGAAAEVYYGKGIADLNLAQYAMIAGLPKAPSTFNPIANPTRAVERRNYVLSRMLELERISEAEYEEAVAQPVTASYHGLVEELNAPYLGEMARAEMIRRFGPSAYTDGYRVFTTLDSRLQRAANRALFNALMDYDRRYGYRGPVASLVDAADDDGADEAADEVDQSAPEETEAEQDPLANYREWSRLQPGLVVSVAEQSIDVLLKDHTIITVPWEGLSWAKPYLDGVRTGPAPKTAADIVALDDVIYVEQKSAQWWLAQPALAQGALVSLDHFDGAITALSGGADFQASKFNRVIQAERQPGSSFKPFIYTAALDNGLTPASVINDAPVVFEDELLEDVWRPENDTGRFYGPTRLREALVNSRNLVSIRVLMEIGIPTAVEYVQRFGFERDKLPRDLSLALGSITETPLNMVTAYAVLGNGGFRVQPYFIDRIEDMDGEVIYQANPAVVCPECSGAPPRQIGKEAVASEEFETLEDQVETLAIEPEPLPEALNPLAEDAPATTPVVAPVFAEEVLNEATHYLITDMMRDVILRGTGRRALVLGRNDLAGKTGTTNEYRDAWFSGFNPNVVTTAWVGFDDFASLGPGEYGGRAALPMWIEYMDAALKNVPDESRVQPQGLVTVRISPETGKLARADDPTAIFETFKVGTVPEPELDSIGNPVFPDDDDESDSEDELF